MEELNATEHPLDTSDLRKGSIISAETIEHAFGVRRGTEAYRFALMRASDYIAHRLAERGDPVTVVERKHNLVVLTDTEASTHNERAFDNRVNAAARSLRRLANVDRSQLDPDRLASHDRALEVRGRVLSAARRARRTPALAASKRQTPALKR